MIFLKKKKRSHGYVNTKPKLIPKKKKYIFIFSFLTQL